MPKKGQFSPSATADSVRQRKYNSKPESKIDRASRNAARAEMASLGKVKKGDGKDVDHKDSNPQNNSKGNTRVLSKSKNRAMNKPDKKK